MPGQPIGVRIGELSRRVGVAPETLRAWERRYGVLQPSRTRGGYRVYGRDDERRARRMRELIAGGWAAGEAAHAVTRPAWFDPGRDPTAGELLAAVLRYDSAGAHLIFDRVVAMRTLDTVLHDVVLPVLRGVGDRWERGEVTVGQEHFASELIGGRLRGLTREWGGGLGPRAVLACPSGERHDLGLLCCGVALNSRGWRVTYLGADTPDFALEATVAAVEPDLVLIGALLEEPMLAAADSLAELAARVPVAAGGAGCAPETATRIGARYLGVDPVTAAAELTAAASR
jgi:MerR family transcriptional regulator, light-induced transcriptional regulator